jgi:hypothetical protein
MLYTVFDSTPKNKELAMTNLSQMMKQAQEMQTKIQEMQDALAEMEVTGQSGGGMCQVTLTGKGEARRVKIDPALVNPSGTTILEDLLLAAFNDAKGKTDAQMQGKMQEITGGLGLPPGFNLPF